MVLWCAMCSGSSYKTFACFWLFLELAMLSDVQHPPVHWMVSHIFSTSTSGTEPFIRPGQNKSKSMQIKAALPPWIAYTGKPWQDVTSMISFTTEQAHRSWRSCLTNPWGLQRAWQVSKSCREKLFFASGLSHASLNASTTELSAALSTAKWPFATCGKWKGNCSEPCSFTAHIVNMLHHWRQNRSDFLPLSNQRECVCVCACVSGSSGFVCKVFPDFAHAPRQVFTCRGNAVRRTALSARWLRIFQQFDEQRSQRTEVDRSKHHSKSSRI